MNRRKRKIIFINTPQILNNGGIANYFRSIKDVFDEEHKIIYNPITRTNNRKMSALHFGLFYVFYFFKLLIIRPNLVHLNPSFNKRMIQRDAIFLKIASILGIKSVCFWHGWNKDFEQKATNSFKDFFYKNYKNVSHHIVLASEFKQTLREWHIVNPISIFTTTIDKEFTHPFTKNINVEGKVKILFLSRIEKVKGIYESLDIFRELRIKHDNIELYVAGNGSVLNEVKSYVKEHNIQNIFFVGYVRGKEKLDLMKECDIYLFPTFHGEGLPISVLEAMSCGMPIVVIGQGGLKDLITKEMGLMELEYKKDRFIDYLKTLILNPEKRSSIGKYNYEYARQNFSPKVATKKLQTVYNNVLIKKA